MYLDDILIYTEDESEGHVQAVRWVLDQLRKFSLYANLKKCCFHQEEVRFLGDIVSSQDICMEDERIRVVKQWPEPKSVRDIQVFLGFANFYWRFIKEFSCIAAPLISMLKTTGSIGSVASPKKSKGGVDGNSVVDVVGGSEVTNSTKRKNPAKTTKSKILVKSKNHDFPKSRPGEARMSFFIPKARLAFTQLRQVFVKAPILHHFDPESYIRIETDASGYAIGGVLSQLFSGARPDGVVTKDDLGQWHPVAFFSRKMIPAETRYETHDGELLAIVEAFKTWRHYLEGCKHEVLVLTDHNNLRRFMDTKSLSSRQVRWAQELSRYHFRIDYRQGKANGAADALSQYSQQNAKEEAILQAKNTKILHWLQSSLANVSGLSLDISFPLNQIFVCGTAILP